MTPDNILTLILGLPNWAGFLLLAYITSKNLNRLLDIIDHQQAEIEELREQSQQNVGSNHKV